MVLSDAGREEAAKHFATRSTITPEQWDVIERELLAKNAANFNGGDYKECLSRLFERMARDAP